MTQDKKDAIQLLVLALLFILMLCIDHPPHPHICVDSQHIECKNECGCKGECLKK